MILGLIITLLYSVNAMEMTDYLTNLECTIDRVDNIPSDLSKPFIFHRGDDHLDEIQRRLKLNELLLSRGNTSVGLDYAGSGGSPTKLWRASSLKHYILNYIMPLSNMSVYESLNDDLVKTYLWGPTDECERHRSEDECQVKHQTEFVPTDVHSMYTCPWEGNTGIVWGLAGKYTGLPWHQHRWVSNELIYGKKLWLLYDKNYKIDTENKTSIELLFDMVNEYIDDPEFVAPQICVQNEGDVINVPRLWNHMTFNLETVAMVGCIYDPE